MSTDPHRVLRERLGAYVLGQLDPDSEARISHHVAGCDACQAEVTALAPVVPLLAAVHPDELNEALQPPDTLPGVIRRRIAAEQRRAQWVWLLRTLAAAAVVVLAFSLGYAVRSPAAAPLPAPQPTPSASPTPTPKAPKAPPAPARPSGEPLTVQINDPAVTAKVRVIGHRWGAELRLEGAGFQNGAVYLVRVYVQNGSWITAGSFVGAGSGKVRCALTTGVRRSAAVSFTVLGPGEVTVLSGEM